MSENIESDRPENLSSPIAYFARRVFAFIIDLSLFQFILFILIFETNFSGIELIVIFLMGLWCLSEALLKTSPGKKILGLQITTDFMGSKAIMLRALRFCLFFVNWWLLFMCMFYIPAQVFPSTSSFQNGIVYILIFVGLYGLLQPRLWKGTRRLNHDILTCVVPGQQKLFIGSYLLGIICFLLGALTLIAFPNSGHSDAHKPSHVKANMHSFQTMVETYAVDWGEVYPRSSAALLEEANQTPNPYWKELVNPFTDQEGFGQAFQDLGQPAVPGSIAYEAIPESKTGEIKGYKIYGYDKGGKYVQDKNVDFILKSEPTP